MGERYSKELSSRFSTATFGTPGLRNEVANPLKSRAFASRYASSVPWKSRCSWVMLVTTATSKSQPATRCWASPWEVTSRTAWVAPVSAIRARYRWRSGGSGVVVCKPVSISSPPMRAATVVTSPALRPAARRMAWISVAVVVLPSVPVTPTTVIRREGNPSQAAQSQPQASRASGTRT